MDWGIAQDIVDTFAALGFPKPKPIPIMKIKHQIAQKLHAASIEGGARGQDIVDLQLIAAREQIDYPATRRVCARLFAYRKQQSWPPVISKGGDWDSLYREQADGLDVLPNVDQAAEWANEPIRRINFAED